MKLNKIKVYLLCLTTMLILSGCDLLDSINVVDDVKEKEERNALEKEQRKNESSSGLFKRSTTENDDKGDKSETIDIDTPSPSDEKKEVKQNVNKDSTKANDVSDFSAEFDADWTTSLDADTIKIRSEDRGTETIRLLLIDTPESVHPDIRPQLYGHQASRYVKKLQKDNKNIVVKVGNPTHDDYGRLLAYVYLSDGTMLNKHLVDVGYARVGYIFPPNTQYLDELLEAQEKAKSEKVRIWSVEGYVTDKGFNMEVVKNEHFKKAIEQDN
ncbi:thermonuclease family protein [Lysinibacillus sphaericus]|uniref:thermonuclease family protein n=1 Tax=Lysinibacillus sphaericus TaxID=1421 RepID=UPI0018CDF3D8|nr:thermonuclease family protein [Lysinibacillus sphaericus]